MSDISGDCELYLKSILPVLKGTETSEDTECCDKKSVVCDSRNQILRILMPESQLNGSLPNEIGGLKSLVQLDLQRNNLVGSIPPSYGELKNLELLYLQENQLSGKLPRIFNDLNALREVKLNDNEFAGDFPLAFRNLKNLTLLYL